MNLYKKIDIALDTFPYNGVTTSFEAIWMGAPVISMQGYNFNSRCGSSINKNLNLNDLISKNEEDYISKAVNLSKDKNQFFLDNFFHNFYFYRKKLKIDLCFYNKNIKNVRRVVFVSQ